MMTSYFNLLKYAATGQASPDMSYFDKMRASTLMGGVVQTLTGQPPLTFKADGTPLISWSMKGNAVQNGTPAPDNIVMPGFVGVRTTQLFDENSAGYGEWVNSNGTTATNASYAAFQEYEIGSTTEFVARYHGVKPYSHSIAFYDSNGDFISRAHRSNPSASGDRFDVPSGATKARYQVAVDTSTETMNPEKLKQLKIMLNLGSTALDYEPYGWKVPFENHGENLFDKVFTSGYHLSTNGNPTAYTNDARCATLEPIDVSGVSTVTFSFMNAIRTDTKKYMYSLFNGSTLVTIVSNLESGSTIDASQGDKLYLCVYSSLTSVNAAETTTDTMLTPGSTPKPYSPYLNETVPIYLGEAPTVRRVKKLVLTGEESVSVTSAGMAVIVLGIPPVVGEECVCSHYIGTNDTSYSAIGAGECTTSIVASGGGNRLAVNDVSLSTADAYKAFFAAQYAAGTPVTVWYVLDNEQTGIVNEPLAKIGDYADELSSTDAAVTIPTVKGSNTLTVDTPIQPSEITISYRE